MEDLTAPQKPPLPNDQPGVWDLVIADMKARDDFGRKKYGTPVQPGNGRDALIDAYQEVLDLAVYLRLEIEERRISRKSAPRGPMEHVLKCIPLPFEQMWKGLKKHEVRVFDRDYRAGDFITLKEYDPVSGKYSGRAIYAKITHITEPGHFGLPKDVGVFSVSVVNRRESEATAAKEE